MASLIAQLLAGQSLRIQAQRAAAETAPEIDDDDVRPAALTAEAVPVFKTARTSWQGSSVYLAHVARHAAAMAGHDADKAEAAARAFREEILLACARANYQSGDAALDTI